MKLSIWLPGVLPGMNEIIAAAKGCHGTGRIYSAMKARENQRLSSLAMATGYHLTGRPIERFTIAWNWAFLIGDRHDPDNLVAAAKFVLDALVTAKVIAGDGYKNVMGYDHVLWTYADIPGVTVTIAELPPLEPTKKKRSKRK